MPRHFCIICRYLCYLSFLFLFPPPFLLLCPDPCFVFFMLYSSIMPFGAVICTLPVQVSLKRVSSTFCHFFSSVLMTIGFASSILTLACLVALRPHPLVEVGDLCYLPVPHDFFSIIDLFSFPVFPLRHFFPSIVFTLFAFRPFSSPFETFCFFFFIRFEPAFLVQWLWFFCPVRSLFAASFVRSEVLRKALDLIYFICSPCWFLSLLIPMTLIAKYF